MHGGAPIGVNEPGVNLRGIEKKDIRRGMVIVKPGSVPRATTRQAGQAAPDLPYRKAAPAAAPADARPDTPTPAAQTPEPVH